MKKFTKICVITNQKAKVIEKIFENKTFRAETINCTNGLVGYQSTSRCQYYEIG